MTDEPLWDDPKLAEFLGRSVQTLRNERVIARREGRSPNLPPVHRLGVAVRYVPSEVRDWFTRQSTQLSSPGAA